MSTDNQSIKPTLPVIVMGTKGYTIVINACMVVALGVCIIAVVGFGGLNFT